MKAKLEFDLDDPSDRRAHMRCTKATSAYVTLFSIDNKLREYIRYEKGIAPGDEIALPDRLHQLSDLESELINQVLSNFRFEIGKIMEEHGVDLYDLE